MKRGTYCPLLKKGCIEDKCVWFCQVRGVNPNTGEPLEQWQCAISLLPFLMIENSQQQRSTAAAVESFRNETVTRNDTTNALLYNLSNKAIEAVQVNVLEAETNG
jgi:hypothetical protein